MASRRRSSFSDHLPMPSSSTKANASKASRNNSSSGVKGQRMNGSTAASGSTNTNANASANREGGSRTPLPFPPQPPLTPSEFFHGIGSSSSVTHSNTQGNTHGNTQGNSNTNTSSQLPMHPQARPIANLTTQTIYSAPSWARQQAQRKRQQPSGLAIPMTSLTLPAQHKKGQINASPSMYAPDKPIVTDATATIPSATTPPASGLKSPSARANNAVNGNGNGNFLAASPVAQSNRKFRDRRNQDGNKLSRNGGGSVGGSRHNEGTPQQRNRRFSKHPATSTTATTTTTTAALNGRITPTQPLAAAVAASSMTNGPKVELPNNTKRHRRNNSHDQFMEMLATGSNHSNDNNSNNSNANSNLHNKLHSSGPIQFDMADTKNTTKDRFSKAAFGLNISHHSDKQYQRRGTSQAVDSINFDFQSSASSFALSPLVTPKPALSLASPIRDRRNQKKRNRRPSHRSQQPRSYGQRKPTQAVRSSNHNSGDNNSTVLDGNGFADVPATASNSKRAAVSNSFTEASNNPKSVPPGNPPGWDRWSSQSVTMRGASNPSGHRHHTSPLRSNSWELGTLHTTSQLQPATVPIVGLDHPLSPSSDLDSDIEIDFDGEEEDEDDDINDMEPTISDHFRSMHISVDPQRSQDFYDIGLAIDTNEDDDVKSFASDIDMDIDLNDDNNEQGPATVTTPPLHLMPSKWDSIDPPSWDITTPRAANVMSPHLVDRRKGRSTNAHSTNVHINQSNTHSNHTSNNGSNIYPYRKTGASASVSATATATTPTYVIDDGLIDDIECGSTTAQSFASPITHTFVSGRARRRRRRHQQQLQQQSNATTSNYWAPQHNEFYKNCLRRMSCLKRSIFPTTSFLWQLLVLLAFGCGIHLHASHRIAIAHEELHATHVEKTQILQQMEWMNRKSKEQRFKKDSALDPQTDGRAAQMQLQFQLRQQQDDVELRQQPHDPSAFDSVYAALFGPDDEMPPTTPEEEAQKSDLMLADAELSAMKASSEASLQFERNELLQEVDSLQSSLREFAKERMEQAFASAMAKGIAPQIKFKVAKTMDDGLGEHDEEFELLIELSSGVYPYTTWMIVHQVQNELWDEAEVTLPIVTSKTADGGILDDGIEPLTMYDIQPSPTKYERFDDFKMHWFELSEPDLQGVKETADGPVEEAKQGGIRGKPKAPLDAKSKEHGQPDSTIWSVGIRRHLVHRQEPDDANDDASPDPTFPDMIKTLPHLSLHKDGCKNTLRRDMLEICFGEIVVEDDLLLSLAQVAETQPSNPFVIVDASIVT